MFISNNLTNKKHPFFRNRGDAPESDFDKRGRLPRGRAEWDEIIAKIPESRQIFTAIGLR